MVYTTFVQHMRDQVQKKVGQEGSVEIMKIQKLNGVFLQGLLIRKEAETVTPTIYLDHFYDRYCGGRSMDQVAREFMEVYEQNRITDRPDLNYLQDYERVKKQLGMKLVNYDKNREMLREIPHVRYLNLAVIFCCHVTHPVIGRGNIMIREEHIKIWNITKETLFEDALLRAPQNAPCVIRSIDDVVDMMTPGRVFQEKAVYGAGQGEDPLYEYPTLEGVQVEKVRDTEKNYAFDPHHVPEIEEQIRVIMKRETDYGRENIPIMLIASNAIQIFGASVMLYPDMLQKVANTLNKDLYILPSSIHELILLPDMGFHSTQDLLAMVKEVNRTQVAAEDFLADAVYYYDRKKRQTEVVAVG